MEQINFTDFHIMTKVTTAVYVLSLILIGLFIHSYGFSWWAVSTVLASTTFVVATLAIDRVTLRLNPTNTINDIIDKASQLK